MAQAQFSKLIGAIRVLPEEATADVKTASRDIVAVALSPFHY
ncbi:hypothetical protein [Streptomyces sp. NPDC050564]